MEKQFVAFKVESSCYCIDIMEVQEVIRENQITTMPNFPSFVEGVINLRGTITPLLSIDKRLKCYGGQSPKFFHDQSTIDNSLLETQPQNIKISRKNQPLKLIIVKIDTILIGLLVDTLDKILTVDETLIQSAEGLSRVNNHKMVTGILQINDEIYTVLNPKYILENDETLQLTETLK